jgi:hypothetical protein
MVIPHLVAWVRVGHGIPHGEVFVNLSLLSYSKENKRKKNKKNRIRYKNELLPRAAAAFAEEILSRDWSEIQRL